MPLRQLLPHPDLLVRVLELLLPAELIRLAHTCSALREFTGREAPAAFAEEWRLREDVVTPGQDYLVATGWRQQCLLTRASDLSRTLGERITW